MGEPIMPAAKVAEIHNEWGGSVYEGAILRLCDSHEQLQADLAAMTAVARRYRDDWIPSPDERWATWWVEADDCHNPKAVEDRDREPMTDAEAAALDALETDDA